MLPEVSAEEQTSTWGPQHVAASTRQALDPKEFPEYEICCQAGDILQQSCKDFVTILGVPWISTVPQQRTIGILYNVSGFESL